MYYRILLRGGADQLDGDFKFCNECSTEPPNLGLVEPDRLKKLSLGGWVEFIDHLSSI